MIAGRRVRKFAITVHVIASVGWLGAVVAFLGLAMIGLTADDARRAGSAYVSMQTITSLVIVPLAIAGFASGIVQSLISKWGIVRHYWVIAKLVLTLIGSALLWLHVGPIEYMAETGAAGSLVPGTDEAIRVQLVADAVAAIALLAVTTGLAFFKPAGVTPYGWRKEQEEAAKSSAR